MSEQPKRFEDWEKADCNECGRYWLDQCDGVPKDSERQCNSFLATRSIVIPARLKALEKRVKWLRIGCILSDIALLLFILAHLLRWI